MWTLHGAYAKHRMWNILPKDQENCMVLCVYVAAISKFSCLYLTVYCTLSVFLFAFLRDRIIYILCITWTWTQLSKNCFVLNTVEYVRENKKICGKYCGVKVASYLRLNNIYINSRG